MQNAMFRDTEVSTEVTCRCPQCGAEEKVPVSFPRWMLDIFRDKTPGLCAACSEKIRQRNQQEADRREAMRRIESAGVPPEFRQWDAAKGNGTLARFIRDHRDRNLLVIGANGKCKTRAAAYNLLLEAKAGQRCRFCDYPELALEYAAAMQKSAQEGLDSADRRHRQTEAQRNRRRAAVPAGQCGVRRSGDSAVDHIEQGPCPASPAIREWRHRRCGNQPLRPPDRR